MQRQCFRGVEPGFALQVLDDVGHGVGFEPFAEGRAAQAEQGGQTGFEFLHAVRAGMDELRVIDEQPGLVLLGVPADPRPEGVPAGGVGVGHLDRDGGLHERPEDRPVPRLVDPDHPRHALDPRDAGAASPRL